MSTEQIVECINLEAAADLSAKQFFIVYVDSNGKAALTAAATTQPIGVLQNTPTSGQAASVAIRGVTKLSGGAALTIGQQIGSDSAGQGTALTLDAAGTVYNYAVGRVIKASGAADGLAEVVLYSAGLPVLV